MLKLANHITFVNSVYKQKRLLKSQGPKSLDGLRSFRFKTIPDGLPDTDDANATQEITALCSSTNTNCLALFKNLLSELNSSPDSPPVTCIVSDGAMTFTLDAAQELGLPGVVLQTQSASSSICYLQFVHFIEKGLIPLKGMAHHCFGKTDSVLKQITLSYLTNGYLETVRDWIPGIKSILLRDIPTFIRTTDTDDVMIKYIMVEIERAKRALAIVLNTFDALDHDLLEALSSILPPPVYSIGYLHLQVNQIPVDHELHSIGSNLWREETECLEWLNTKASNSVVYVNFGSITVMTGEQLIEFAWGLANSNMTFLWVIRPDLVSGKSAVLPPEFMDETKGRSWLSSWCPQEQILNHPAIGGFLTHCGWNSTIESVCAGVPIICWPFFADQQTNCRFCCKEWGIGMEIDDDYDVKRNAIQYLVRKLMEGKEGKEMRKKALDGRSWQRRPLVELRK